MKNVNMYYFSGTGNSKAVSSWMADEFKSAGKAVTVCDISRKDDLLYPDDNVDMIGFIYPTHGFNAIPIMLHFIMRFPAIQGKEVFLINNRAGMKLHRLFLPGVSGLALLMPLFILFFKGFKVGLTRSIDLPSNWVSVHPGLRKRVILSMFTYYENKTRKLAKILLEGKRSYNALLSFPLDILLTPISFLYYLIGRFALAKTFAANKSCTACELCVKSCPLNAIKMLGGSPYWTFNCESCMKCINICPEKAIQTTHGFTGLLWYFAAPLASAVMVFAMNNADVGLRSDIGIFNFLFSLIEGYIVLAIVGVVYYLTHHLKKIKLFDIIIKWTSLTNLPFWRKYRGMR